MKKIILNLVAAVMAITAVTGCADDKKVDPRVFCFYYNWYGNVEHNGQEVHWAHGVIGNSSYDGPMDPIPGKDNIAANFYPELGNYSSTDPETIARHVKMMADARVGVIVVTWWGKNDFGTPGLSYLFDEADKYGMKVCFHIEPYGGRGAVSVRENIIDLTDMYGDHNAYYRLDGKPAFFIYDSYITPASEWARVFTEDGDLSIRGTKYDAVGIGLWVKENEQDYFLESGLDGFYTYFAADGFTYGSTAKNWKGIQEWASANDKIFIPCVGPGYIDTRVRPWNASTTRDREDGKYYERMFKSAIASGAPYIGITSFNEWHEGTQIEPAVPFKCDAFEYLDYSPLEPDAYLKLTSDIVSEWK